MMNICTLYVTGIVSVKSLLIDHCQLVPPQGLEIHEHFRRLIEHDLSFIQFEERMLDFLSGLHRSQPRPILAQVESGNIYGLSHEETRALRIEFGIP